MLSRLEFRAAFVHLIDILGRLELLFDVVLEFGNGLQHIGRILELADVLENICDFVSFAEVDHSVRGVAGDAVFDEDKVGEVDPYLAISLRKWVAGRRRRRTYQGMEHRAGSLIVMSRGTC